MNQEERLEVVQGQAETSLVQANMLLQMPDYSHLHQSETIIGNIKAQLGEEDGPLYQGPVAKGDIPIFISPTFPEDINKLAIVGGGRSGLTLRPSNWPLWEEVHVGVALLSGLQTGHCGRRYM